LYQQQHTNYQVTITLESTQQFRKGKLHENGNMSFEHYPWVSIVGVFVGLFYALAPLPLFIAFDVMGFYPAHLFIPCIIILAFIFSKMSKLTLYKKERKLKAIATRLCFLMFICCTEVEISFDDIQDIYCEKSLNICLKRKSPEGILEQFYPYKKNVENINGQSKN
jgi:hypothetical protein